MSSLDLPEGTSPPQRPPLPAWGLDALFEYHACPLVAELLRTHDPEHPRYLAAILGGVRPAPGRSAPPSYLAMCDPCNPAGERLNRCGQKAWTEILDACAESGAGPRALAVFSQRSPAPLRRLLSHLWFWRLHQELGTALAPASVPGAAEVLEELAAMRRGPTSWSSFVLVNPGPEVQIFGGVAVVLGHPLDLGPQPAEILALALRPGGTSFEQAKADLSLASHETEGGITARVHKLKRKLKCKTRSTPFTIQVSTKGKRITAVVQMKPIQIDD